MNKLFPDEDHRFFAYVILIISIAMTFPFLVMRTLEHFETRYFIEQNYDQIYDEKSDNVIWQKSTERKNGTSN